MTLRVGEVYGLAFTPDGRELLCGSSAGPINRHPLDGRDLFAAAKARVTHPLTPGDLERFAIDTPLLDLRDYDPIGASGATSPKVAEASILGLDPPTGSAEGG
jgi:hypothetical protein